MPNPFDVLKRVAVYEPIEVSLDIDKIKDELKQKALEAQKVLVQSSIYPSENLTKDAYVGVVAHGIKNDEGKPRMELLSAVALEEIARVMTFGAQKYDAHNWRKGFVWSRLYGAALRHLLAHMDGKDRDEESGLSHLAHAACCLMFLLEHEKKHLGTDDRYKGV